MTAREAVGLRAPVFAVLGMLAMLGPFGTDVFLPALPTMADDLVAPLGQTQLALTGVVVGMGAGQLLAGPLSDTVGRRTPLLIGCAVSAVACLLAAAAPGLPLLVLGCLVSGLGISFGLVVGRAVVADVAVGPELTRGFAVLGTLGLLGPVLAPSVGVLFMALWGWRGIFVAMAVLAALAFAGVALLVPESLPRDRRATDGFAVVPRTLAIAFRSRPFLCGAVVVWAAFAALFAYIAGSSFLVQGLLGFDALGYALVFGVNGVGIIIAGALTGRLARRVSEVTLLRVALTVLAVGVALVAVAVAAGLFEAWIVLPGFFLIASSAGLYFPPAISLALADLQHVSGTALAILGAVQFLVAGVVAPLVAIGGEADPVPFVVITLAATMIAWLAWFVLRPQPVSPEVPE